VVEDKLRAKPFGGLQDASYEFVFKFLCRLVLSVEDKEYIMWE
jgi:hypothetical protein